MFLRFLSFASGSSGNAYFIGTSQGGILIDAGVSPRALKKGLADIGIPLTSVLGVCVTHDHIDHIQFVGAYSEKLGLPIYATAPVLSGIVHHPASKTSVLACKREVKKDEAFSIGDFRLTAFEVPHDGSDNVGYMIQYNGYNFVIATDLGHIPNTVAHYLKLANYLVLEANYDAEMLEAGPYPTYLKNRIRQSHGHLCNSVTADFVAENYVPGLSHLFLCHLSNENNHPELASKTVEAALSRKGIIVGKDIQLICLPRRKASECYVFGS